VKARKMREKIIMIKREGMRYRGVAKKLVMSPWVSVRAMSLVDRMILESEFLILPLTTTRNQKPMEGSNRG
jgi:hypothetical protein